MTPEGRIKKRVTEYLTEIGAYRFMPVTGGYGGFALDYICAYRGWAFSIETKAPGGRPTPRQTALAEHLMQNMTVFLIETEADMALLINWCDTRPVLETGANWKGRK